MTVKVKAGTADPASPQLLNTALALRKIDVADSGNGIWVVRHLGGAK